MLIGTGAVGHRLPTESGFLVPLLAGGNAYKTGGFCDPDIDQRMNQATRLQLTNPRSAHQRWSSIEHGLIDRAPFVPVAYANLVNLLSERVGNYQSHPQWGPLLDQMWVR
jgi:hypothetical protein